jgi:hypothetical protein
VEVYVFDAKLEQWGPYVRGPASRRLALRASETLAALHELIQEAFAWDDDHLYSFWLDGKFWGADETEYTLPFDLDERRASSSEVRMDTLGLERGQKIAYIFDFGDEWRLAFRQAARRQRFPERVDAELGGTNRVRRVDREGRQNQSRFRVDAGGRPCG